MRTHLARSSEIHTLRSRAFGLIIHLQYQFTVAIIEGRDGEVIQRGNNLASPRMVILLVDRSPQTISYSIIVL